LDAEEVPVKFRDPVVRTTGLGTVGTVVRVSVGAAVGLVDIVVIIVVEITVGVTVGNNVVPAIFGEYEQLSEPKHPIIKQ